MRTTSVRPRVVIDRAVAIRPAKDRTGLGYGALGAVALVSAAFVIGADGILFRAYMGLLGMVFCLAMLYMRALVGAAVRGSVRVAEGDLRFVRPRSVAALPLGMGALATMSGALSLVAPAWTGESFALSDGVGTQSLWAGVVALGGVVGLVIEAWSLRLPTGLVVDESGLVGVRGGPDAQLPWERLESASVVTSSTGACLAITAVEGSVVTIQAPQIGSDPNVVAAIIEHFRTHPEDREVLGDAREAIRRVEAAHA
jgi:hypothetical protein